MNQRELAQLIKRYRSGTATEEEKEALEKVWSLALQDNSAVEDLPEEERKELRDEIFSNIKQEISARAPVRKSIIMRPWFWAAATVLLVVMVSVGVYWYTHRLVEIKTQFGERLTVVLPDNSFVKLNGNSMLRYGVNWSEGITREVWVDGECFFEVKHTADHQKFIVHTSSHLRVEVLGTKFNVKSREYKSEVMLTEGKVKLNMQDNAEISSVFLEPGELATMDNQKLSKRAVRQKQYTSWVTNKLFFDQTPLGDVAMLLKETYGLNVTFEEPALTTRELSGEISSATADDILYAIAETFGLQVKKNGNDVSISLK